MLSEAERQSLRAGLIKDSEVVTQMLVDIDVEEAKAEQESDHRQLSVRLLLCCVQSVILCCMLYGR